jgi:hypothetical protein
MITPEEKPEETIEPIHGLYWYCQHSTYPDYSVLAGQHRRQLVHGYDTLAEAIAAHPTARVENFDNRPEPVEMSRVPPPWFDPSAAGEVWNEEEY